MALNCRVGRNEVETHLSANVVLKKTTQPNPIKSTTLFLLIIPFSMAFEQN
jgi:hypothetical protein